MRHAKWRSVSICDTKIASRRCWVRVMNRLVAMQQKSRYSITVLAVASGRRRRDRRTDTLGALEVDDQFIVGWRLHRQVGWLLAFEDAIDVRRGARVRRRSHRARRRRGPPLAAIVAEGDRCWAGGSASPATRLGPAMGHRRRARRYDHDRRWARARSSQRWRARSRQASRGSIGRNSVPRAAAAAAWIAAYWPIPAAMRGVAQDG